jgi:hypothetical protein
LILSQPYHQKLNIFLIFRFVQDLIHVLNEKKKHDEEEKSKESVNMSERKIEG